MKVNFKKLFVSKFTFLWHSTFSADDRFQPLHASTLTRNAEILVPFKFVCVALLSTPPTYDISNILVMPLGKSTGITLGYLGLQGTGSLID